MGYFEGIAFLSKYLKKHGRNFLIFFLAGTVETVLTVYTPILLAIMVDQVVYFRNIEAFLRISFVFMVMTVFSSMLVFVRYTVHGYLMSMYTFDIKIDIFRKLLFSKAEYLAGYKSGEVINTIIYDSAECMLFMIRNVIHFTNVCLKSVFYLAYIYIIDVRAGLLVTVTLPLAALITLRRQKKVRDTAEKERSIYGSYVSWLFEILKGLGDIKLLRAEGTVRRNFLSRQKELSKIRFKARLVNFASDNIMGLVNLFLLLAVFGLGSYLSYVGQISIGNIIVLLAFVKIMNDESILYMVHNFFDAQARLTRIGKIRDFLSTDDESDWKGSEELVVKEGKVEFRDVSFSYDEKRVVLDGLNLIIQSGTHFALAGKSGCGNTSIANLLAGFYEPESGDILIDDISINSYSLQSLRRNIGVVQQDILLFDGTIRENILLGNLSATYTHMEEACRKAGIKDYIDSLPDRLETVIGKDGMQLSGGQKQRLEIARIYLKNPAIIIFDEATSSLDAQTEKTVHEAWKEALKGRTAIVISHRESSILLCDQVAMIQDGKAQVIGDPRELLCNDKKFKSLFAVKEAEA